MNDKDILELEKQLIPDLPADFWEIKEAADRTYSFWDRIIYYGLGRVVKCLQRILSNFSY